MPPAITLALPAYNEEATLASVVRDMLDQVPRFLDDFEILIIDDGSSDGTAAIADSLAASDARVRVVHHQGNRGFSGAMMSAITNADGELVAIAPADGQAHPEDLERLVAAANTRDLVFTYRIARDDPWGRKAASWLWYLFIQFIVGARMRQFSSLFLFRRRAVAALAIDVRPGGANFLPVLYATARRSGMAIGWVGTVQPRRLGGRSHSNLRVAMRSMREGARIWWRMRVRPRRLP